MKADRTQNRRRKRTAGYVRRSILLITVFTFIVIFGTYNGSGEVSAHDGELADSDAHKYYKSIEVKAGDTLWNIAEEYMDESYHSVNDYVNELIEINQLGSGKIHEGRYLTVVYRL